MALFMKQKLHKLKPIECIDMDEKVLVSKRLLMFALVSVQDDILWNIRNNNPLIVEFTDAEMDEYIEKSNKLMCPDGYYQLLELINGEKFND